MFQHILHSLFNQNELLNQKKEPKERDLVHSSGFADHVWGYRGVYFIFLKVELQKNVKV